MRLWASASRASTWLGASSASWYMGSTVLPAGLRRRHSECASACGTACVSAFACVVALAASGSTAGAATASAPQVKSEYPADHLSREQVPCHHSLRGPAPGT